MKLNQYFSVLALVAVFAISGCGDNGKQAEQESAKAPAQESTMADKPAMEKSAPAAVETKSEEPTTVVTEGDDAEDTGTDE